MRMSCNGCRVLRKGCSENCCIRPCLDWIKSPDAQANATLFLAKFYGRAGLLNLINAGPSDLRPAIFKSLLYEACGRIVNPIYGSSGLLWTGSWSLCQAAVEAVLKGSPITPIPTEESTDKNNPCLLPFEACDIRHVSKNDGKSSDHQDLHKLLKPVRRTRFKRSGLVKSKLNPDPTELVETKSGSSKDGSGLSHHSGGGGDISSAETVEVQAASGPECEVIVELDLTLWFGLGSASGPAQNEKERNQEKINGSDEDGSEGNLALGLAVAC
ncbi:hypothetical protein V2J09_019412 [Rumex salicifolius]